MAVTNLYHTTTWAGPVSSGAAGSTLQDSWVDVAGSTWSINASNQLAAGPSPGFTSTPLVRPTSENAGDSRIVAMLPASVTADAPVLILRRQTNGDCYFAFMNPAGFNVLVYKNVSGFVAVGTLATTSAYVSGHDYELDITVEGTTTVTITGTLTDKTTSTIVCNAQTATDASPPASLQGTGQYALSGNSGGEKFGTVKLYNTASSGVTASAGVATATATARAATATGAALAAAGVASAPATAYAASASAGTGAVAVDNAALTWSPYNWYASGSAYKLTNCPGAYVCFSFTGASLTMAVDASTVVGTNAVTWRVDDGDWQSGNVTSATSTVTLATGLAAGTHKVFVIWKKADNGTAGARWTAPPTDMLKITGFTLASGASVSAYPTVYPRNGIGYWDSMGEGIGADGSGNHNAAKTALLLLREALGMEIGVVAFGAQGYSVAGGAPPLWTSGSSTNTAWDKYYSGQSRLVGGLLSPQPALILSLHGSNDALGGASDAAVTAAVNGWLTAIMAAAPGVPVVVATPPGRYKKSALAASNATATANPYLLDWDAEMATGLVSPGSEGGDGTTHGAGPTWASADELHPLAHTHARLAARLARAIERLGVGTGLTITSISPSTTTSGGSTFTLTVNGTGFVSGATVYWNGAPLTTTYVSSTQLTASVANTLIAAAGTASVTVVNP